MISQEGMRAYVAITYCCMSNKSIHEQQLIKCDHSILSHTYTKSRRHVSTINETALQNGSTLRFRSIHPPSPPSSPSQSSSLPSHAANRHTMVCVACERVGRFVCSREHRSGRRKVA